MLGLLQVLEYEGQWVALLDWEAAVLKLAERDDWIGWNNCQRADRRGLVVLNRHFLVLPRTRMPNLASRCLSMAIKALPGHWEQVHMDTAPCLPRLSLALLPQFLSYYNPIFR